MEGDSETQRGDPHDLPQVEGIKISMHDSSSYQVCTAKSVWPEKNFTKFLDDVTIRSKLYWAGWEQAWGEGSRQPSPLPAPALVQFPGPFGGPSRFPQPGAPPTAAPGTSRPAAPARSPPSPRPPAAPWRGAGPPPRSGLTRQHRGRRRVALRPAPCRGGPCAGACEAPPWALAGAESRLAGFPPPHDSRAGPGRSPTACGRLRVVLFSARSVPPTPTLPTLTASSVHPLFSPSPATNSRLLHQRGKVLGRVLQKEKLLGAPTLYNKIQKGS